MSERMGEDGKGVLLSLDGQKVWVNEAMLFSIISSIIVFLEMIVGKKSEDDAPVGDIISVMAEGIYDKIQNPSPSGEPQGL
jgi:hypothetical protein